MQITCTSLQTENHTNTSSLNYSQAGCSSWRPTNNQVTEGRRHWVVTEPGNKSVNSIITKQQQYLLNVNHTNTRRDKQMYWSFDKTYYGHVGHCWLIMNMTEKFSHAELSLLQYPCLQCMHRFFPYVEFSQSLDRLCALHILLWR